MPELIFKSAVSFQLLHILAKSLILIYVVLGHIEWSHCNILINMAITKMIGII